MSARYQIHIKDQGGGLQYLLTDESPEFRSLYFTHLRNTPGQIRLELDGSLSDFFVSDGQIEVRRQYVEYGINDWYTEWEGFHVTPRYETLVDGTTRFISNGAEYLDLARREEMGYYAGSSFTDLVGPGETVLKQIINQNIGPGASNPQRIDSSAMPGLTIEADQGRGSTWTGSRAWKSLMENLQEISDATGLAYNIVGTGPATFEFRVYDLRVGADRSDTDIDIVTGKNGSGNDPVRFAISLGNMITPALQGNYGDAINTVYVLGQGEESARQVIVVKNAPSIAVSPWNRRVLSRNATQETTVEGLTAVGDSILKDREPKLALTFSPVQTPSTVYGLHYFFGDLVSAEYRGIWYNLEITEVECTVNESGEDLRFTFS